MLTLLFLVGAVVFAGSISKNFSSSAQKLAEGKADLAPESGTISGRVFQDFNGNGNYDTSGGTAAAPTAVDSGIAAVTVSVYDSAGAPRGTGSTSTTGVFSIAATGTGPYRVEFTSIPPGFSPSARSNDSVLGGTAANAGSTVHFVNDGNTANVNLALNRPGDFCGDNPEVCSQRYETLGQNSSDAIYTIPYRSGSTSTVVTGGNLAPWQVGPRTSLADMDQVGTTFGLAYSRSTRRIFASAFMKKHAAFGPGGTGAIYQVNRNTGVVSEWANLNTTFGANTAGANPHNIADYNFDNGQATWTAVGLVGLGGLAINDAETVLYTMNLANKTLYEIPANVTPTSGNIRTSAFPATMPGCTTPTDVRPFAVSFYQGLIYVGAICSGDATNDRTLLEGYVYTVNPTTLVFSAAPVFQFPLDYDRVETDPGVAADFLDWTTTYNTISAGHHIRPQPWLTDIDFDRGNLILSIRDRNGDQTGYNNASDPNNPTDFGRKGITAGEILRACGSPTAGWTLETNGSCGGTTSLGAGNLEGVGGGEYYYQENYKQNGTPHDEVGLGAAHQIPGFNDHIANIFDPVYNTDAQNIFDAGGHRWFSNVGATAGQHRRSYLTYNAGDFGKANGLGNVIALCEPPPIEIGNRLWIDVNNNGVQDPNELPVQNAPVQLWADTDNNGTVDTQVGAATSNVNGHYIFGGANNTNMTVACGTTPGTANVQVNQSSDDAEQQTTDGAVVLTGTDLDFFGETNGGGTAYSNLGVRFNGLNIPPGATITSAFIEFTANDSATVSAGNPTITIQGENADNASTFTTAANDISGRTWLVGQNVTWTPGPWTNGSTTNTSTPSLVNIVQSIVNRGGWNSGNSMAFRFTGTSTTASYREAETQDDISAAAPRLVVAYTTPLLCTREVLPNTAYQVRIPSSAFDVGQPLGGYVYARADVDSGPNSDARDSDGIFSGGNVVKNFTTGGVGENNHTYDFGFLLAPTAANVSVEGRVLLPAGNGVRNATIILTEADGTQHVTRTGSFGYYRFSDIEAGQTVIVSISSKRFTFNPPSRVVNVTDNVAGLDFIAQE